jgi:cysteine-rich repeat protein
MLTASMISMLRGGVFSLSLMCLLLLGTSCSKLESVTCPSGLTCPTGMTCAANQDICIDASPSCGDGIVQASVNELCDDGNVIDGDGCSQDCKSDESCGNGKIDKGEVCDNGNTVSGDGCSADCRSDERCGNGVVDAAAIEICDNGNTIDGDGCSADCRSDERCGNGVVDTSVGERCDPGDILTGDGCSADCRSGAGCGNGFLEKTEQCDDGNQANTDDCVEVGDLCVHARCGDGFTDTQGPVTEECDDAGNSQACDLDCTLRTCGDGFVNTNAGEQCDPGTAGGFTSACNSNCTLSRCGDGITNTAAGEECDDGNISNEDWCLSTCQYNRCGNGTIDAGEVCDDGNPLACGTCGVMCNQVQLDVARGRIQAVAGSALVDGERFTISDGYHYRLYFEFDKDNAVSNGYIAVPIKNSSSASEVATAIEDVLDAYSSMLDLTADDRGNEVTLVHSFEGSFANDDRIDEHVSNVNFKVSGLSDGKGFDCPAGTGCTRDADCYRNGSHATGRLVCRADKTCGLPQ